MFKQCLEIYPGISCQRDVILVDPLLFSQIIFDMWRWCFGLIL